MTTTSNASQVRRPWRATARTVFQGAIGALAMLPLVVEASGLDETAAPVAGAVAISAGVTRVMALPAVELWLRRFVPWLAAEPRPVEEPAGVDPAAEVGALRIDAARRESGL